MYFLSYIVYPLLAAFLVLIVLDRARQQIKKNAPPSFVQWLLRTLLISPSPVARLAIYDLTKPSNHQKKWIKRFDNHHWKGAIIAHNIESDTAQTALNRLKTADLVIYEVHGGGFRVGHCVMYMEAFISWLTVLKRNHGINAVIMSIEYGLAPRVSYPGPVIECINSYRYLTSDLGVSPSKIIVSGDSAGGIISLEMLCHIYAPGLLSNPYAQRTNFDMELPVGILLSSPVVSVDQTSESWKKYAESDIVSHKLFELVIKEYLALKKNKFEMLAMLNIYNNLSKGGMDHICQGGVLFFVGEKEVFSDDIFAFADIIKNTTSNLTINVCKAPYAHDWYLIREIVRHKDAPMVKQSDDIMAEWCNRALHRQLVLDIQSYRSRGDQQLGEKKVLLPSINGPYSSATTDGKRSHIYYGPGTYNPIPLLV
ncbi:Alpha/Beta hydrolase protein [Absidia repens]|uniref:Alpha/Beta hydrolase protein n=1 Tax=Absidia repens TaxID=90262 RepID=A0A1X2IFG7_9FUNG|nr:Alpha/Beta hydrolase protein [Absidia repens]